MQYLFENFLLKQILSVKIFLTTMASAMLRSLSIFSRIIWSSSSITLVRATIFFIVQWLFSVPWIGGALYKKPEILETIKLSGNHQECSNFNAQNNF